MDIIINNNDKLASAIDQYGDVAAEIEKLEKEAKSLKKLIEDYAQDNRVNSCKTDRFQMKMKMGEPSLRLEPGKTEKDVLALLEQSEVGKMYIYRKYDSKALKEDFANIKGGKEQLKKFGLKLTETKRHLEVTSLA